MTTKVSSLGARRTGKAQDSRLWTPLEMLEDVKQRIEGKRVKKMVVHWWEQKDDDPEGPKSHHWDVAGVTFPDHIAILSMALKHIMEDWTA